MGRFAAVCNGCRQRIEGSTKQIIIKRIKVHNAERHPGFRPANPYDTGFSALWF